MKVAERTKMSCTDLITNPVTDRVQTTRGISFHGERWKGVAIVETEVTNEGLGG